MRARRGRAERGGGDVERLVPGDAPEVRSPARQQDRESRVRPASSSSRDVQALEVGDVVAREEVLGDRRLHVGRLRLDRLLADLGEAAALVAHAAHADRAQVLQALWRRRRRVSRRSPPASRAFASV